MRNCQQGLSLPTLFQVRTFLKQCFPAEICWGGEGGGVISAVVTPVTPGRTRGGQGRIVGHVGDLLQQNGCGRGPGLRDAVTGPSAVKCPPATRRFSWDKKVF
jgi:hypothetical protein